jgi:hypothetical protein
VRETAATACVMVADHRARDAECDPRRRVSGGRPRSCARAGESRRPGAPRESAPARRPNDRSGMAGPFVSREAHPGIIGNATRYTAPNRARAR